MKLHDLLVTAIGRGYAGITGDKCRELAKQAKWQIWDSKEETASSGMVEVEDLASHLSQAVADEFFEVLPDF